MLRKKFQQNPRVLVREENDGEAILYDLERESTYIVNRSGLLIWRLCEGSVSKSYIIDQIRKDFKVTEEMSERIEAFIEFLLKKGLLMEVK